MLVLQDPADRFNDLGRKAFAWRHIQATFVAARDALLRDINAKERPESLLKELVGGCEEVFGPKREAAKMYARKLEEPDVVEEEPENIAEKLNSVLRKTEAGSTPECAIADQALWGESMGEGDEIKPIKAVLDDDLGIMEADAVDQKEVDEEGSVPEQDEGKDASVEKKEVEEEEPVPELEEEQDGPMEEQEVEEKDMEKLKKKMENSSLL
jgi:hypothetical protein